MIYLDQAATSHPKPDPVVETLLHTLQHINANPGRGAHRQALAASRLVFEARETVADFFGLSDSSRVIFTSNASEALNLAIHGLALKGSRVVCSSYEHNSVLRPFYELNLYADVQMRVIPPGEKLALDLVHLEKTLADGNTSLLVLTHASNVSGEILPIVEAGERARHYGVPFVLDASQTAGHLPIDLSGLPVDYVACPGHKGLLGPQGTGLLLIQEDAPLPKPMKQGGTGGNSEARGQPVDLPDRFESGTLNTPGIAALGAAVEWLAPRLQKRHLKEQKLTKRLVEGLRNIRQLKLLEGVEENPYGRVGCVSFLLPHRSPSWVAEQLDVRHDVLVRAGLHCAPLAHGLLGSAPDGAVRISLSADNSEADIDHAVRAVEELSCKEVA